MQNVFTLKLIKNLNSNINNIKRLFFNFFNVNTIIFKIFNKVVCLNVLNRKYYSI